jgi:hypothetical protein
LDSEWIDSREVSPAHAGTFQGHGRIEMLWVISVAELEGAAQYADLVIVGFPVPFCIRNSDS